MKEQDIVLEIETRISTLLDGFNQLAQILQECKDERGWTNFSDPITGKICKVDEGVAEDPDITIKAKAETGVKLFRGEMDPMRAFLLGRVKVSGDLNLGMKLVDFFDRP